MNFLNKPMDDPMSLDRSPVFQAMAQQARQAGNLKLSHVESPQPRTQKTYLPKSANKARTNPTPSIPSMDLGSTGVVVLSGLILGSVWIASNMGSGTIVQQAPVQQGVFIPGLGNL